jgi:hypothetical protein
VKVALLAGEEHHLLENQRNRQSRRKSLRKKREELQGTKRERHLKKPKRSKKTRIHFTAHVEK